MRAADTNVIVRLILGERSEQASIASTAMNSGEPIYVSSVVVCELVWVLKSRYQQSRSAIVDAIGRLVQSDQVVMDRDLVLSGLSMLSAGGGFADGVILHEARRAGARDLMTFDRELARIGSPLTTLLR